MDQPLTAADAEPFLAQHGLTGRRAETVQPLASNGAENGAATYQHPRGSGPGKDWSAILSLARRAAAWNGRRFKVPRQCPSGKSV